MTTDFRAMCAELLDELEIQLDELRFNNRLCIRARALLAQPVPEGPTDDELLASVRHFYGDQTAADMGAKDDLRTARAVLARWGTLTPQPVPVNERLPGPEDCDDEGYCWWWCTDEVGEWWEFLYLRDARDHNRRCGLAQYTHWLPYRAIPNLPNPND